MVCTGPRLFNSLRLISEFLVGRTCFLIPISKIDISRIFPRFSFIFIIICSLGVFDFVFCSLG